MKKLTEWFGPKKTLSRVDREFKRRELSHELRNEPGGYARKPRSQMRGVDPDYQKNLERLSQGLMKKEEADQIDEDKYDNMLNAMLKGKNGERLLKKHSAEVKKSRDIESGKALEKHIKKNPGVLKTYSNAVKRDKKMYGEEADQIDELNKNTLKSYVAKATDSARTMPGYGTNAEKSKKTMRLTGVSRATEKLAKEEAEQIDPVAIQSFKSFTEEMAIHPKAVHVVHVGGGKYKVHAVGSKFADGIKVGEHLTDTHLDDIQDMGGKIKEVKPPKPMKD